MEEGLILPVSNIVPADQVLPVGLASTNPDFYALDPPVLDDHYRIANYAAVIPHYSTDSMSTEYGLTQLPLNFMNTGDLNDQLNGHEIVGKRIRVTGTVHWAPWLIDTLTVPANGPVGYLNIAGPAEVFVCLVLDTQGRNKLVSLDEIQSKPAYTGLCFNSLFAPHGVSTAPPGAFSAASNWRLPLQNPDYSHRFRILASQHFRPSRGQLLGQSNVSEDIEVPPKVGVRSTEVTMHFGNAAEHQSFCFDVKLPDLYCPFWDDPFNSLRLPAYNTLSLVYFHGPTPLVGPFYEDDPFISMQSIFYYKDL